MKTTTLQTDDLEHLVDLIIYEVDFYDTSRYEGTAEVMERVFDALSVSKPKAKFGRSSLEWERKTAKQMAKAIREFLDEAKKERVAEETA